MYIRVKQLSKATPRRKREKANTMKLYEKAVITPARAPIRLQRTKAGMRPYRSAM